MNGRERVHATLAHQKTDRPALSFEATYEVIEMLVKHFGIDKLGLPVSQLGTFLSPVGEKGVGFEQEVELRKKLGVDQVFVACPTGRGTIGNFFGLPLFSRMEDGRILGAWDIVFKDFAYPWGTYIEIDSYPLAGEVSLERIRHYPVPDLDSIYDYKGLEEVVAEYNKYGFFILLNMHGCFDVPRWIRGHRDFFMDLSLQPEKAEVLMDKVLDYQLAYVDRCMAKVSGRVDGVFCGDDFGTQIGMAISPAMWRKLFKPRYRRLISRIKDYGLKFVLHCDGGIRPIIPDLIELGLDVLHPIQPLARGMNPRELADDFGEKLTFYGGIDTQHTMPFGTPEDVRNEVLERLATLGKHNGYIVASCHNFQPDVPQENVLAMYEAVLGYDLT